MLDEAWALSPSVALRPEPFGALAYDFSTRQLSFLKTPTLVDVVRRLASAPDVASALAGAGVPPAQRAAYLGALGTLATTAPARHLAPADTHPMQQLAKMELRVRFDRPALRRHQRVPFRVRHVEVEPGEHHLSTRHAGYAAQQPRHRRRGIGDVAATDRDPARARRLQPGDEPQQRRLAAARRPDDDDELPVLDRQIGWREDMRVAEAFRQT